MCLVSVIVPAYNQARYLGYAIQSALDQTYTNLEVIVVDDGSTDDTAQVAQGFQDQRIHYIFQENKGLSAARNTGIRNSRGSYLSFLDSDDAFLPDKLNLLLRAMNDDPDLGMAAGQAVPIDSLGCPVGEIFDKPLPDEPSQLLLDNPLHVGSVLLLRKWQDRVGFFDESLHSYEDWDYWLRLANAGCKMGWIAEPVSYYRFHPAQMTRIGNQMTKATFAVLDKIFSQPDLPIEWCLKRKLAYSHANLRAAAQSYHSEDLSSAKAYMAEAVRLNPELADDEYSPLACRISGWTNLPKASNPLMYLERIYRNLPACLGEMQRKRHQYLGQFAIRLAFSSFQQGKLELTHYAIVRAFRYQPRWLLNRGALSIFLRSMISPLRTSSKLQ